MTIKLEDIKAGAKFVDGHGRVFRILQLMYEEEYFLAQDGHWFVMEAIPKNKEEMLLELHARGCKLAEENLLRIPYLVPNSEPQIMLCNTVQEDK